jgi:hypothetical protein
MKKHLFNLVVFGGFITLPLLHWYLAYKIYVTYWLLNFALAFITTKYRRLRVIASYNCSQGDHLHWTLDILLYAAAIAAAWTIGWYFYLYITAIAFADFYARILARSHRNRNRNRLATTP